MDHTAPVKVGRVEVGGMYTDERRKRPFVYTVVTRPKGLRKILAPPTSVEVHDFYDTAQLATHRLATISQLRFARKGGKR